MEEALVRKRGAVDLLVSRASGLNGKTSIFASAHHQYGCSLVLENSELPPLPKKTRPS